MKRWKAISKLAFKIVVAISAFVLMLSALYYGFIGHEYARASFYLLVSAAAGVSAR